jgi:hypothetical protein
MLQRIGSLLSTTLIKALDNTIKVVTNVISGTIAQKYSSDKIFKFLFTIAVLKEH